MIVDTLIVIPARLESSRLQRKLLQKIDNATLIERVAHRISMCETWADWVVATDSEAIADVISHQGWPVMMTSSTHTCGTERCAEAAAAHTDVACVINVQGDEPFVMIDDLKALRDIILSDDKDIATLYTALEDDELESDSVVKVAVNEDQRCEDFYRTSDETSPFKHIGVYAFRKSVLLDIVQLPKSTLETERRLEQMRWLQSGYSIYGHFTSHDYLSIDTQEELGRARIRIKQEQE